MLAGLLLPGWQARRVRQACCCRLTAAQPAPSATPPLATAKAEAEGDLRAFEDEYFAALDAVFAHCGSSRASTPLLRALAWAAADWRATQAHDPEAGLAVRKGCDRGVDARAGAGWLAACAGVGVARRLPRPRPLVLSARALPTCPLAPAAGRVELQPAGGHAGSAALHRLPQRGRICCPGRWAALGQTHWVPCSCTLAPATGGGGVCIMQLQPPPHDSPLLQRVGLLALDALRAGRGAAVLSFWLQCVEALAT